jgi:hypothetical protein
MAQGTRYGTFKAAVIHHALGPAVSVHGLLERLDDHFSRSAP